MMLPDLRTRPGQLRERIALQAFTATQDAVGEPIKTWTEYRQVWARAIYLAGSELEAARKMTSDVQIQFTIRHIDAANRTSDVEAKWRPLVTDRVSWNSKTWNIHAVLQTERKTHLSMLCSEVL